MLLDTKKVVKLLIRKMEAQIIPDRLYWICDNAPPRNKPNAFYFSIDNFLVYQPFAHDFGPLNLAMT